MAYFAFFGQHPSLRFDSAVAVVTSAPPAVQFSQAEALRE